MIFPRYFLKNDKIVHQDTVESLDRHTFKPYIKLNKFPKLELGLKRISDGDSYASNYPYDEYRFKGIYSDRVIYEYID